MAQLAKFLSSTAGVASGSGGGLDIDECFSCHLYEGTGSAQTITNGIDLSGEGGLVWTKARGIGYNHGLIDTERGVNKDLRSNDTFGEETRTGTSVTLTAFNSDGFSLGQDASSDAFNRSGVDYVSWTFRKAPKFFDCVSWSGNSTAGRNISHSLGSIPAVIIIKPTSFSNDWLYHYNFSGSASDLLKLNRTNAAASETYSGGYITAQPTDTTFQVGNRSGSNASGHSYVAYLFAHHANDGEFGPDSDQDIIKCDSFSSDGSGNATVNVGFEPQWIMIKRTDGTGNWQIANTVQGWDLNAANPLFPNLSTAESDIWGGGLYPTATGFQLEGVLGNSRTFIYMAIRRGPLAAPDDATKVFSPNLATGFPRYATGFVTDFTIQSARDSGSKANYTRLTGTNAMRTTSTSAEFSSAWDWAQMTGSGTNFSSTNNIGWNWKRAPGYFDVVAYTGTGSSSARAVPHNLGVVPEMMWVKQRATNGGEGWAVYHKDLNGGNDQGHYYVTLNSDVAEVNNFYRWADTAPTATNFYVTNDLDRSGGAIIAYLFATVAGVSKVGSYTGTGSSNITVDCGFSSGARFVLIKRTDASGTWWIADTVRGLVSGNDNLLELNSTAAELTGYNMVEPSSSGFIVNGGANKDNSWNDNGGNYIFYAIA